MLVSQVEVSMSVRLPVARVIEYISVRSGGIAFFSCVVSRLKPNTTCGKRREQIHALIVIAVTGDPVVSLGLSNSG